VFATAGQFSKISLTIMKKIFLLLLLNLTSVGLFAQHTMPSAQQQKDISSLIDKYSEAREKKDTVLLKSILTSDVDQLVSTGEWRRDVKEFGQHSWNENTAD
jgi:hypothetical protein